MRRDVYLARLLDPRETPAEATEAALYTHALGYTGPDRRYHPPSETLLLLWADVRGLCARRPTPEVARQ